MPETNQPNQQRQQIPANWLSGSDYWGFRIMVCPITLIHHWTNPSFSRAQCRDWHPAVEYNLHREVHSCFLHSISPQRSRISKHNDVQVSHNFNHVLSLYFISLNTYIHSLLQLVFNNKRQDGNLKTSAVSHGGTIIYTTGTCGKQCSHRGERML